MGSDGLVAVYYMLAIIGVIVVLHGDGLLPASCWVGHDGYVCNAANPPSKGVVPCWESVLIWDRSTRGKWCRPGNHGRDFENWGGLRGLATSTVSHHEPVAASSVRGRVRAYQWVHAPTGRRRYQGLPEDNPSGIWGKGWICAAIPVRVIYAPIAAVALGIDLLAKVVTTVTMAVD